MFSQVLFEQIQPILLGALGKLQLLSSDSSYVEKMTIAFGNNWDRDRAKTLIQELASGNSLPDIAIVSAAQINGGNGAFDRDSNTIYLSQEFLLSNDSGAIENVLLEELGHAIDANINSVDAAGDEGAIFAVIVQEKLLSDSQLAALKAENDTTTATIDGQVKTLELATSYGNISIDGNLNDWTAADRLDFVPGSGLAGYELYGKYAGDAYVFALKSNGISIGANTTIWLNTDRNPNTGFQIFGLPGIGGAEYKVNFFSDNLPYLYTGAAIDTVAGTSLDYAVGSNNQIVEFAVPISQIQGVAPASAIDVLADINNTDFLPQDYSNPPYTLNPNLPQRTDFSKKVAIVFSETTANKFFDKKAYTQLFMSMQYQAMMAGVPFDILTENDLTNINNLVNYDAIIFPSFRNAQTSQLNAIQDTLSTAVYKYNIGLIAAGDFLTNDENGNALPGDSYIRMKQLLDVTRTGGSGPVTGALKVENNTHPMMDNYAANETIRSYNNIFISTFGDGIANDGKSPTVLADFEVGAQSNNAVLATQTGGRNVHFATESFLGDNNLVWQALQWVIYDNKPTVRLNMSRDASIFIARNDMDQSQEFDQVNPSNGTQGIYQKMNPIITQWKNNYNFVGSYYINVGNNPPDQYTDWTLSKPYYDQILALGNEIGTHSYTHPADTGLLTPDQLRLQFHTSKAVIEKQLGIQVVGAAIPGNPEPLFVSEALKEQATFTKAQLDQFDPADSFNPSLGTQLGLVNPNDTITIGGLPYVTGGYSGVGAGYPGAFGFMFPGDDYVYFSPNMSFDFSLIGFRKLTAAQAELVWQQEYNEIVGKAAQPIVLFPWHDYGPTLSEPGYTEAMYTNFIARAYNDNTEFVTLADLSQRIKTFDNSQLFVSQTGNTITAKVNAGDVGKFSLNVDGNLPIQNVNNWYAYDNNTIFLPKTGGDFTINLGATQDDVTRIIDLPMRSELLSLSGDGTDLNFTFVGDGQVKVDLKAVVGKTYQVVGANSQALNGEILTLQFNSNAQHNVSVKLDKPPTVANPIANVLVNEDAADTVINLANVFTDIDNNPAAIVKTFFSNTNPTLITAKIVNNNLTLDYLPNQFGTTDITIRGTSNGLTVDDTFTVTVNPVDDAPIVVNPIANVAASENSPNAVINLASVFTDIDNDPAAIVKTVVGNNNTNVVNATISNSTLTLDYLQFGTANITVRGTSNGLTADNTFTVTVNPSGNVINGNDSNNDLKGTSSRDIIYGFGGNDKIDGKEGHDLLYGGTGNDLIYGAKDDDILFGEAGHDSLAGEDNNDTLYGGDGSDGLSGGNHNDVLIGVNPNRILAGSGEIDSLKGDKGSDRFVLGDKAQAYYNDGNNTNQGFGDFVIIEDFKSKDGDVIQLHGTASNYNITTSLFGTDIYLKTSGTNEYIGLVAGVYFMNANSSAFSYS